MYLFFARKSVTSNLVIEGNREAIFLCLSKQMTHDTTFPQRMDFH